MEKQFILILNNEVINVTIGDNLEAVQSHFPDYTVEEFVDVETVHAKYGYSRFFPEPPKVTFHEEITE